MSLLRSYVPDPIRRWSSKPTKGVTANTTISQPPGLVSSELPAGSAHSAISANILQPSSHARYWWEMTGHTLAVLLETAGYSLESQYRNLLFYHFYVTPELGADPRHGTQARHWDSFMTDNFTPVEFSWSWGSGKEPIVIRYSVEPIGLYAGTPVDPLNEHAANRVIHRFNSLLPAADLAWYHHFSRELTLDDQTHMAGYSPKVLQKTSQKFIAFDLEEEGLTLKAYFIPSAKAAMTGLRRLELVSQAVKALPQGDRVGVHPSYSTLFNFLFANEQTLGLEVEILGIDCILAEKSRLKVYVRSPLTTFDSVRKIMTLDGIISTESVGGGLEELQELWQLLLWNKRHFESCYELPSKKHRTAGVLYYFEIRPGHAHPTPKIYIPVRHYTRSDRDVSNQLMRFLSKSHRSVDRDNYIRAMNTSFPARRLQEQCGAQTYIGCTIKEGSLNVISYINPGIADT